jgi:protein TonB
VFAAGLVGALHLGIGLVIARAYFALPPQDKPDTTVTVTTERPYEPPPVVEHKVQQTVPHTETEALIPHDPPPFLALPPIEPIPVVSNPKGSEVGVVPMVPEPPLPPVPPVVRAPPVIANPSWLSKPTADQIGKLYPTRALDRELSGKATLLCEIQATGAVNNCDVVDETPKGYRFGEAAQAMTKYFKLNPRTEDGVSVAGSKVRIPIVFNAT